MSLFERNGRGVEILLATRAPRPFYLNSCFFCFFFSIIKKYTYINIHTLRERKRITEILGNPSIDVLYYTIV